MAPNSPMGSVVFRMGSVALINGPFGSVLAKGTVAVVSALVVLVLVDDDADADAVMVVLVAVLVDAEAKDAGFEAWGSAAT